MLEQPLELSLGGEVDLDPALLALADDADSRAQSDVESVLCRLRVDVKWGGL